MKIKEEYYNKYRNQETLLPINGDKPNFNFVTPDSKLIPIFRTLYDSILPKISSLNAKKIYSYRQIGSIIESMITDFEAAAAATELLTRDMKIVVNADSTSTLENPNEKFRIYDDYFNFLRSSEVPIEIFADQVILVSLNQLYDLVESAAAVSEVIIGLKGLMIILEIIVEELPNTNKITEVPTGTCIKPNLNNDDEKAIYRWKVGHAFFALLLIFSRDSLLKIKGSNGAEKLHKASTLYRASTAAMWFASIFSPKMYMGVIRPSMVSTKAPGGFSGSQNREFYNWALTKAQVIKWLQDNKNHDKIMISSAKHFADIYLQDGEQHILLAAAMVENKTSLVQDDVTEKYGVKMTKSAVQLLRDILDLRKSEIEFINNLKY